MKLTVLTPDATLLTTEITSINIGAKAGSFTILANHAPLITTAKDFVMTIATKTDDLKYIAASVGTIKVADNTVAVIIDYGIAGSSRDDAQNALLALRQKIAAGGLEADDSTVANLELELIRRMSEMRN